MNHKLSPTLRVMFGHSASLFTLVALIAVALWLGLWWVSGHGGNSRADTVMHFWRVASAMALILLGVRWSIGVLDAVRPTAGLQPGRQRALANAACVTGTVQVAIGLTAGAILAWLIDASFTVLSLTAESAMAFTIGASLLMSLVTGSSGTWFLLLWLVWPVAGYLFSEASPYALQAGSTSLVVNAAWSLGWPACALLVRWLIVKQPRALLAWRTLQQNAKANFHRAGLRADVKDASGNPAWLLAQPASNRIWITRVNTYVPAACALFLSWIEREHATPSLAFAFGAMVFWGAMGYDAIQQGVRPVLLLLPGCQWRSRLGWLLWRAGLQRGLSLLAWWMLPFLAVTLWLHPKLPALHVLVPLLIMLGAGMAGLALLITAWLWVKRVVWRAVLQLATTGSAMLGGALGAYFWYRGANSADATYYAQGMLFAAALMALGPFVLWAGRSAWARTDLHALLAPVSRR